MKTKEQEAKDAIKAVFNDTKVSQSETKGILEGLIEEIEMLVDTLEDE